MKFCVCVLSVKISILNPFEYDFSVQDLFKKNVKMTLLRT